MPISHWLQSQCCDFWQDATLIVSLPHPLPLKQSINYEYQPPVREPSVAGWPGILRGKDVSRHITVHKILLSTILDMFPYFERE